jgi:replicative DNA helicase Mcm
MSATEQYEDFFKRYYWEEVLALINDYPNRKTLIVDFREFIKFNFDAANRLIERPDSELKALTDALTSLDMPADGDISKAVVVIKDIPDSEKIPIYKIGHDQVNKLISIEGRVTRIAPQYQKLTNGAFKCQRCGDLCFLPQQDERYVEPFECQSDACGRKGPFKLIPEESEYEDQQKIGLQDLYESAKPGQPLREIIVVLSGSDLIASVPSMGAQCTITGIVRLQQKIGAGGKLSEYKSYLEAVHIEPKETEIDISISEAEKREFKELVASSDITQTLINSTAPEVLGYYSIKLALLCAIVSGAENPQFREYMHMILCGDPGTAKSLLLRFARAIVPRSQYSAGKSSSVAGLTVAVVKDELSGGGWMAQAGALVLADRGLMVLDEADKLEKEDFQALNTALEEGFIEIHKGGINQRFNTRCSVIALCNPKYGRFDAYEPLVTQIAIPPDIFSRFDLIFKILDKPDPVRDREIAKHQTLQWERYENGGQEQTEENSLSQEKLTKYIQFAKTIKPRTTPETREAILEYYLTLRKIDETGTIATTARQNNGLYRLTKAIAKLRLSDTCCMDDVEKAIQIHTASLEAFKDPITGKIDADIPMGSSKSQRDRIQTMKGIIKTLQDNNEIGAYYPKILAEATSKGIKDGQVSDFLKKSKLQGDIIEISDGYYRVQ